MDDSETVKGTDYLMFGSNLFVESVIDLVSTIMCCSAIIPPSPPHTHLIFNEYQLSRGPAPMAQWLNHWFMGWYWDRISKVFLKAQLVGVMTTTPSSLSLTTNNKLPTHTQPRQLRCVPRKACLNFKWIYI